MMTPTRKSGRQPKPSARLKEYLYDNDTGPEKTKGPSPKEAAKKTTTPKGTSRKELPKETVKRETVKRASPKTTKTIGPRMVEKKSTPTVRKARGTPPTRKTTTPVKTESQDTATPARKSRRTPKPSAKLQEFLYDDRSNDSQTSKQSIKVIEKAKKLKIKEEKEDYESMEESEEEDIETETEVRRPIPVRKQANKPVKETVPAKKISNKMTTQDLLRKQMQSKSNTVSHRERVTSLTSVAAKKERNASRLTFQKGKIYRSLSPVKDRQPPSKRVLQEKTQPKKVASNSKVSSVNKRKREPEVIPTANKKFIKTKDPSKLFERAKMAAKVSKESSKENAYTVEKKEIEKVLQVNKEVMTQLLNFGAEVAEAMACNNESIFSFSTKDNPLQSFKIDKQQDDFSDEEVVKIIKWFEEEEEQRRTYRKRILEALRASHETNMSLYSQMLKMLQSVTTC